MDDWDLATRSMAYKRQFFYVREKKTTSINNERNTQQSSLNPKKEFLWQD